MDALNDVGSPFPPSSARPIDASDESRALASLEAPLERSPRVWIPAAAEASFYRLNHLDVAIAERFAGIAGPDPDEDDVEEVAPEVRRLIADHVLLDAWVDAFYDACRPLGPRVRLRRPNQAGASALNGRPALLALRAAWAETWSDDAIVARLRAGGNLRAPASPFVVHADDRPAETSVAAAVERQIGKGWSAYTDDSGAITRLAPPS